MYVAVADERGIPREQLGGTVQNDILKEYIARGTYIYPHRALDAPGHRHLRLLRRGAAALEHHLHQRLPHARGRSDRGPGAGLHAGRRHRLRRGCGRAGLDVDEFAGRLSFFFGAWSELFEEVAKFRAARRMWARIMKRALRRHRPALDDVPLPRPDRGLVADGPVGRQQRRAHHAAGPRGRARRHAVAAHQRARRGAGPAHAGDRAAGAAHAADHRPRERRDRHARPARRLVLRRVADR